MLIMPVDRIVIILERASAVEIPVSAERDEGEAEAVADGAAELELDDAIVETEAYRELTEELEELTPQEVIELLALAAIGGSDEAEISWEEAVREAQAVAVEDAVDELARIMILSNVIEIGLKRVGYELDQGDETEGAEDEEKAESRADGKAEAKG